MASFSWYTYGTEKSHTLPHKNMLLIIRPYKKILVLRHRRTLKIPPDETFLSWEGKKIAAARQISHADKYNFLLLIEQGFPCTNEK